MLTAIRNTDGVGFYEGGYLYIHSERFQQITDMLRVSRKHVLREMAGLGLLRLMTGDYPHFTYRVQRNGNATATSQSSGTTTCRIRFSLRRRTGRGLRRFAAQMFGLLKQCGALIDECASEPQEDSGRVFLNSAPR